jgi:hypothetical protein
MVTLDEIKKVVIDQLKTELDIMEMLFSLKKDEISEFDNWYRSHPYYRGIQEVVQIVRGGTNAKPEGQRTLHDRPQYSSGRD